MDATGSVIKKIDCAMNKRILVYSLVAHIKELHIVLPIADAILSKHSSEDIGNFLKNLKCFCKQPNNDLKFPICKRIVTDVSYAILDAILKEFNNMNTFLEYLNTCFKVLKNAKPKIKFVVIQYCVSHYAKIIVKDIDEVVGLQNISLRTFLREAIGMPFDFTTLDQCLVWF